MLIAYVLIRSLRGIALHCVNVSSLYLDHYTTEAIKYFSLRIFDTVDEDKFLLLFTDRLKSQEMQTNIQ